MLTITIFNSAGKTPIKKFRCTRAVKLKFFHIFLNKILNKCPTSCLHRWNILLFIQRCSLLSQLKSLSLLLKL